MPAAEHDGHAFSALGADEVAHPVGQLALGAFEVVVLGGDGTGVDKRACLVHRERAECGAQRLRTLRRALAAAVALDALVGGVTDQVHRPFGRRGGGVHDAVPARVLGARAVVAAGPVGCGGEKISGNGIHAFRA